MKGLSEIQRMINRQGLDLVIATLVYETREGLKRQLWDASPIPNKCRKWYRGESSCYLKKVIS